MEGYQVLEANGGTEALDVAARHDKPLDLLLTDVEMPGMDGIELSRSMRAQRPETKVISMSRSATPDEVKGAPFLSKPLRYPSWWEWWKTPCGPTANRRSDTLRGAKTETDPGKSGP